MTKKNVATNASEATEIILPTIWQVPDDLWTTIAAILAELDTTNRLERHSIDQRKALDRIIIRMRPGCQWNQLPKEFGGRRRHST